MTQTHYDSSASDGGKGSGSDATPLLIAITGSIACGKSLIGQHFLDQGHAVIDTDHLAHELYESDNPTYRAVLARFGEDLVDEDGGPINREKLGTRVHCDEAAIRDLEAIVHPGIDELLKQRILEAGRAGHNVIFVLVPLLHECGLAGHYDESWCVIVDRATQIERLMARNGIDRKQAEERIAMQWSQERKAAASDRIIDNSGEKDETLRQADQCLRQALDSRAASNDQPSSAEPQPSPAGERYKDILRQCVAMAGESALRDIGDVSTTHHKRAHARMTMDINNCQDDDGDGEQECDNRQLQVDLRVSVKRNGAIPPDCEPGHCSCGCGDSCRRGCACAADCGCACRRPDEPAPTPSPEPTPGPCRPRGSCHNKAFYALLALLGFLAFALLVGLIWFHPWSHDPDSGSGNQRPVLQLTDEQFDKLLCGRRNCDKPDKPEPPDKPGNPFGPPEPPVDDPDEPGCPDKGTVTSTVAPEFTKQYMHNNVSFRVTEWTATYKADCGGATIVGRDQFGRLVNWQEYGGKLRFIEQWIVHYSTRGDQVTIDRFIAPNQFVGRSVYTYDHTGRLMEVLRTDGRQRPLAKAVFKRLPDGYLRCVVFFRYNPDTGRTIQTLDMGRPDRQLMVTEFYQYESYGQFR